MTHSAGASPEHAARGDAAFVRFMRRAVASLLTAALVIGSAAGAHARGGGERGSTGINLKLPPFQEEYFLQQIQGFFSQWSNLVVGYQVVVLRKNQVVASTADGYADLGNSIPMTTAHKANIGSVMKFLTGTLFFRAAVHHANATGKSVEEILDSPVLSYLPYAFIQRADSSVWKVSFRDLLSHRANWIQSGDFPYDYLAPGINEPAHASQTYMYQNANFSLLGYAIPRLYGPQITAAVNVLCGASVPCARKQLGKQFGTLVRQQLEDPLLGGPLRGSCYAPNPAAGLSIYAFAKNYVKVGQPGPGVIYDERDHLGHCHGAGGWHYSAEDLTQFLINLEMNSAYLQNDLFESWATPTQPGYQQSRLVWPAQINSAYFLNTWGWQSLPFSGGDHGFADAEGGQAEAHAAIVKFPLDYYAIAIVNSGRAPAGWGSRQIATGLKNAVGETFKQMFP